MNKVRAARIGYFVASMAFIFIGALHLTVHATTLSSDSVVSSLQGVGSIMIFGTPSEVTHLWQATSLLMGAFGVSFGLLNLSILLSTPKHQAVSNMSAIVCIGLLVFIFAMGIMFLGPIQLFGAPVGVALYSLTFFANRS